MTGKFKMRVAIIGLIAGSLAVSGCSRVRGHQGFIADSVLTSAVQAGVDNRQSVEASLGRPTFTGQFDESTWYYISRETHQFAFNSPSPKSQQILKIQFDAAGNVSAVDRTGLELVASLSPNGDKTPTLGRERSFFEDIFGNIGAVGAPGGARPTNDPTRP